MKILVIEDEPALQQSIKDYLGSEGYVCETAAEYYSASEKAGIYDYDCVLVDITLPNGSGLDVIREMKEAKAKAGIIIISAKNSVDDKISGLELGADDYIAKPFHLPELNARIKALIRRKSFDGDKEIVMNEIKILPDAKKVFVQGKEVILTGKETNLLLFLIANKNRVITKSSIAEHLWGDNADQSDSFDFIYTHVKNLRKKLLDKGCSDYIQTVYGIGYNFNTNA